VCIKVFVAYVGIKKGSSKCLFFYTVMIYCIIISEASHTRTKFICSEYVPWWNGQRGKKYNHNNLWWAVHYEWQGMHFLSCFSYLNLMTKHIWRLV